MKDLLLRRIALWHVLLLAFTVRVGCTVVANNIIDVQNFRKVAELISGQDMFALYIHTPGLYPYPPAWAVFELAAYQLDKAVGVPFSIAIRLPSILADLGIVYLCWRWWQPVRASRALGAALLYALNPVSLIITTLHGQFDALPTFFLIGALWLYRAERFRLSALTMGIALIFKPYPVLLLPLLLWGLPSLRLKSVYALFSGLPLAVLLTPFLLRVPGAVVDELFGYQGVPLLGFLVPARAVYVPLTGDHFPPVWTQRILAASKWLFFLVYFVWCVVAIRQRRPLIQWAAGVIVLFYGFYAGISPQYLLWGLPLILLHPYDNVRYASLYTATGLLALIGFYAYAVPATIRPIVPTVVIDPRWLYAIGGTLWWLSMLTIFLWILRSRAGEATSRETVG